MNYPRLLEISKYKSSAFIFGPRMTGKTSLLRSITSQLYVDLVDPAKELQLRAQPEEFWKAINALPQKSLVVVDEIQRLPVLLDYVQMGIDRKDIRFLLSGSSARKLKRGAANLLGGRALDLRLHPLTHLELGDDFDLMSVLQYGSLPRIYTLLKEGSRDEARLLLSSYHTTYIKEEVQAEALVRNLAGFQRFLPIAAASDAKIVEYANIARDCSAADSTVKDFFSILEDTLLGQFVWPYHASERRKPRPKFYFFDCGVTRMLMNRLIDPPTGQELGLLFESWFVNEILRLKHYFSKEHTVSFWREGDKEVDILVHNFDRFQLAIEIKSGEIPDSSLRALRAFKHKHPSVPTIVASLKADYRELTDDGISILPWREALQRYLECQPSP